MQTLSKHKLDENELYLLPLGGAGEIGMNLNLYRSQGKWLMVDLGISFDRALGVEVIMPDPRVIEDCSDLEAIVVTHAHEDHIGAIPHLYERFQVPIYATPFTAYLVREKLREAGLLSQAEIIEVTPLKVIEIGPFKVTYIPITHSIPESHVLKIETEQGCIVHTGDWKLDPTPVLDQTNEAALQELAKEKPIALVCDSTNVFMEGESGSELEVRESLFDLIAAQKHRVVVTCFASNVARLMTCILAAKETGREVILSGRSLWRMVDAAKHAGLIDPAQRFLGDDAVNDLPEEKVLLVCTGSQGESRAALTRIAHGTHPKIRLKPGDTVIYSSREIPGNERDIKETQDELIDAGIIVVTDDDVLTHVSGHPCRDELKKMYAWTKPQSLIPVHGERAHLREHAAFGKECGIDKTLAPRNGQIIQLTGEKAPVVVGEVYHGRLALDGCVIVPVQSEALKERHLIMNEGTVFVTLSFVKKGQALGEIQISQLGLPELGQEGTLLEDIEWAISEAIASLSDSKRKKDELVIDQIRSQVRRALQRLIRKKPEVVVHILR